MFRLPIALAALLLTLALPASAQPVTRIGQSEQMRQNTTGYYYYHLPGEATIQVSVEGSVLYPGLYEVSTDTDMRRVLSLAGGPRFEVRDRNSDRRVELRLYRPDVGEIYAANLADASSNPAFIPDLQHDDALIVDVIERRRIGWQDVATVIGTIGTLAFIVTAVAGN
ncbi:MAG: hypothetical protein Rubg2KO_05600 [Rubricoccaceae bacterium]